MRAIILSAGRGSRLLPLTERTPKCLLPIQDDRSILELQLAALADCGVHEALVVVGFGAERVEALLRRRAVPGISARLLFNPFHARADNLVSAWLGIREQRGDFLLLNGDTLFQREALATLLERARGSVTLAVDRKRHYDADDMKVSLDGRRVCAVGKSLDEDVDAESIGLALFRGDGPQRFKERLAARLREPEGARDYYLAAVDLLARAGHVEAVSIGGCWWQEVDTYADWVAARAALTPWHQRLGVLPIGNSPRRRSRPPQGGSGSGGPRTGGSQPPPLFVT